MFQKNIIIFKKSFKKQTIFKQIKLKTKKQKLKIPYITYTLKQLKTYWYFVDIVSNFKLSYIKCTDGRIKTKLRSKCAS